MAHRCWNPASLTDEEWAKIKMEAMVKRALATGKTIFWKDYTKEEQFWEGAFDAWLEIILNRK